MLRGRGGQYQCVCECLGGEKGSKAEVTITIICCVHSRIAIVILRHYCNVNWSLHTSLMLKLILYMRLHMS